MGEEELFAEIATAIAVGDRDVALSHLSELARRRDDAEQCDIGNFREAVERGRTCLRARTGAPTQRSI